MKRSWRSMLGAVALALAGWQSGSAEELRLAPKFDPFNREVEQTTFSGPEISLVSHECTDEIACAPQSCAPSRHVGRDFWVCSDRCGGIIGGSELVYLRPYGSGGVFDTGAGGQMNYQPTMRYWLGYQRADGLGGRIRYWEFDRNGAGPGGTGVGAEFRTFDAELTQTVDFRTWNFLFAGGLRYAETNITRNDAAVPAFNAGFDGIGLTTAAQATRNLNCSGSLRFTAGARWSALYGNSKTQIGGAIVPVRDDLVNILEINVGPQYRRHLRNGSYLTVGAGLEAQYWSNAVLNAPAANNLDVGFVGFASSVAITR